MKKILLICEGATEKVFFELLNYLFNDLKIVIITANTDLFGKEIYDISYLKDINSILAKEEGYELEDFEKMYQLIDMDGCFVDDDKIILNSTLSKIKYYIDHIEAKEPLQIAKKNKIKRDNIDEMMGIKELKILYSSQNLEDAFFDIKNISNTKKKYYALANYVCYKKNLDLFLKLIIDINKAKSNSYKESWEYIKIGNNSLNRGSNLLLLIEDYKDFLKDEFKDILANYK